MTTNNSNIWNRSMLK